MPFKTYLYEPELIISPETKSLDFMYRPYLLVKLKHKNLISNNYIKALVDSGSDYNVFPSAFAKEIGIDYTRGIPHKTSSGIGGVSIYTYGNIVSLHTDIKKLDTVMFFGDDVRIPILGRHGFFHRFKNIEFNVKEKKMRIKY